MVQEFTLERLGQQKRAQGLYFGNLAFTVLFDNTDFEQIEINRNRFQAGPPTDNMQRYTSNVLHIYTKQQPVRKLTVEIISGQTLHTFTICTL